jgi:O-antigen ligase
MKFLRLFYLVYVFSINFEFFDPLNTKIDFLVTKISFLFLFLFSLFFFNKIYSTKGWEFFLYSLVVVILIIVFNEYKYGELKLLIPLILNIIVLIISVNLYKFYKDIFYHAFYVFTCSTIIITFFYISGYEVYYNIENRVSVLGNNQNELSLRIAISIIFINYVYLKKYFSSNIVKLFFLISVPFMIYFLFSTGSRTGFLSLIIMLLILNIFNNRSYKGAYFFRINLVILLGVLSWVFYLKDTYVVERLFNTLNEGDFSGRDITSEVGILAILDDLWLGLGLTGHVNAMNNIIGYDTSPHNVFVEILGASGIIGLIAFVFFVIKLIYLSFLNYLRYNQIIFITILIPVLLMLFSAQVLTPKLPWLIFAAVIASSFDLKPKEL